MLTREDVIANPVLAEGILLKAYDNLPTTLNYTEVAVDDAHSNNISNGYMLAAMGAWRSTSDPFSQWRNYTQIAYINYFLDQIVDDVKWSYTSEWRAEHFPNRLKGEAYALRAYHHSLILQAHAGRSASGRTAGRALHGPLHLLEAGTGRFAAAPVRGVRREDREGHRAGAATAARPL